MSGLIISAVNGIASLKKQITTAFSGVNTSLSEIQNLAAQAARSRSLILTRPFLSSDTWIAPLDGELVVCVVGAGGGGAGGNQTTKATGGYAAGWGIKRIRVNKGSLITVVLAVGGGGTTSVGSAGGDSTLTVGGVTYTIPGALGGVRFTGDTQVAAGALPPAGWDVSGASARPAATTSAIYTGGAGVDICGLGNDATASLNAYGGGTGGISALSSPALNALWGMSVLGGDSFRGGAPATTGSSATATGGVGSVLTGGGGGYSATVQGYGVGGAGGLGAGGGAGSIFNGVGRGGNGGNAYAHLTLFA